MRWSVKHYDCHRPITRKHDEDGNIIDMSPDDDAAVGNARLVIDDVEYEITASGLHNVNGLAKLTLISSLNSMMELYPNHSWEIDTKDNKSYYMFCAKCNTRIMNVRDIPSSCEEKAMNEALE